VKTPTSRVDKLLGSMGYGSRSEIARLGKVGGIVLDLSLIHISEPTRPY